MELPPLCPTTRWIVCIGGRYQDPGELSGLERLAVHLNALRSRDTQVLFLAWNHDWAGFAEHIWATGIEGATRLWIFAYSHGAGHGAVQLAEELGRRTDGMPIEHCVLADPVFRGRHWWSRWLVFLRPLVITVPDNMRHVVYTRQERYWPRGHRVVAADPRATRIEETRVDRRRDHLHMDDSRDFWQLCLATL